jgi:hypothetical protein
VTLVRGYLAQALDEAQRRRKISWNPARIAAMPITRAPQEGRSLTPDEARRLLQAGRGHDSFKPSGQIRLVNVIRQPRQLVVERARKRRGDEVVTSGEVPKHCATTRSSARRDLFDAHVRTDIAKSRQTCPQDPRAHE